MFVFISTVRQSGKCSGCLSAHGQKYEMLKSLIWSIQLLYKRLTVIITKEEQNLFLVITLHCVVQVSVEGRDLKLIESAQTHDNVTSCSGDSDMPNDDPCLKLPCGNTGKCVSTRSNGFQCICDEGWAGEYSPFLWL